MIRGTGRLRLNLGGWLFTIAVSNVYPDNRSFEKSTVHMVCEVCECDFHYMYTCNL